MPGPDGAALRREVRRDVRQAGLPPDGPEAALLDLLRAVPETHMDATAAQRLAAEAGFALARSEVAAMLEALARAGLLGRLPVPGGPPVYDTEARAHAHILDEATATVVDLDVSAETLAAILRQAMADQPGRVEVMLRIRAPLPGSPEAPQPARRPGRPRAAPAR